jgi:DNA processing protein
MAIDGLIVSEHSLGIMARLARGTPVVDAAAQSGSLMAARMANEAGRDVFAFTASIHSPQARGCHALIKQGSWSRPHRTYWMSCAGRGAASPRRPAPTRLTLATRFSLR